MKSNLIFTIFFAFGIISSMPSFGQAENKEKILAKWDFSTFEFLKNVKDSAAIQERFKHVMITFRKDSIVITKKNADGTDQFVKAGPYRFSEDGKEVILGDDSAQILTLDNRKLVVSIKDLYIMHLTRSETSK